MEIVPTRFSIFPYEVINCILEFLDDRLINTNYHVGSGQIQHHICWTSDVRYYLEATILVRRIFPQYWHHGADMEERIVYSFIREYFRHRIQQNGSWEADD
jgi:hypothetical protein